MFSRTPLKPVNRSTPETQSDDTLDYLLGQFNKQNGLKKLGAPNKRFCTAVEYITSNNRLPSEFHNDWTIFLRLALEVLSAKSVKEDVLTAFQKFVSQVHLLPRDASHIMTRSLLFHRSPDPVVQAYINQLKKSLGRAYLTGLERAKIEQIRELERSTSIPRERGDAKYVSDKFDQLPALKQFMESDDTEGRLYGFDGITHAGEVLKSIENSLPQGSSYEAFGKGKKAYIAIEKPCWKQRRSWKRYRGDKRALEKARSELATIQSDMRKSGFDCMHHSYKKQRTEKM